MNRIAIKLEELLTTIPTYPREATHTLREKWFAEKVRPLLDEIRQLPDTPDLQRQLRTSQDQLQRATEALIWCLGASDDFAAGGKAHEEWSKGPGPLLSELLKRHPVPVRFAITEDQKVHLAWYDERPKTVEDLAAFARRLLAGYQHDYGTICHAAAALAIAGVRVINADPEQGGITGFQAGAIASLFVRHWLRIEGPMGRIEIENMLYPQYEDRFRTLDPRTFAWLQDQAKEKLARIEDDGTPYGAPEVRAHWQTIVDGAVPFGYRIKEGD